MDSGYLCCSHRGEEFYRSLVGKPVKILSGHADGRSVPIVDTGKFYTAEGPFGRIGYGNEDIAVNADVGDDVQAAAVIDTVIVRINFFGFHGQLIMVIGNRFIVLIRGAGMVTADLPPAGQLDRQRSSMESI